MTAATLLVWEAAGNPRVPAEKGIQPGHAPCAICGLSQPATADIDKALGKNFADRGHIKDLGSSRVCEGCLWACTGRPPASLRMWSVIVAPGMPASHPKAWLRVPGLHLFNPAAPQALTDLLAAPPDSEWLATVAISAQKHVIPYASTNQGGGKWTIRVEDHDVTATPDQWRTVHTAAITLRRMGIPADAVMAGEPRFVKTADALTAWRKINDQLTPWLGSPLLDLALWTITKETMK
jgi:hypothetical protein